MYYAMHECWYDNAPSGRDIPDDWTKDPEGVVGDNVGELQWILTKMLEALDKPILVEESKTRLRYEQQ
ncbi:MAG: hypothetical protein ACXWNJ_04340 [Vulcanimicrobiaceae bacterium]